MAVSLRNLRILQIFPLGPIISFSDQEVIGLKSLNLVSSSAVQCTALEELYETYFFKENNYRLCINWYLNPL